jgi:hypothetical protein
LTGTRHRSKIAFRAIEMFQIANEKERTMHKSSKHMESDFKLLQGGTLPEKLVQREFAAVQRNGLAKLDEASAIRREAAKYRNQIGTSTNEGAGSQEKQAISKLRQLTEVLAARKLKVPGKLDGAPGVWGNYTLKFTPPYSALGTSTVGQKSSVTGNPTISASGIDNLGQLSCSVDTDLESPSGGTASNLMGVYFKPLFSNATARISFNSEIAFSWYVNSIQHKTAISRAQGLIQLYQYDTSFVQPSLRRGALIGWNESAENELDFDFISETGPTWFLEAPVSSSHFYFVVISLTCSASGAGWPGSLAGARAILTVPSITVTVTAHPVAQA